jgi:selenocysteine lyase/cysteine desulfurase
VFPSKKDYNLNKLLPKAISSTGDFLDYFRGLTYGHNLVLQQKFGSVLKLYLDFTASGQPTKFVNRFLEVVEQLWANPHSSGTAAANFATHATHVAKDIIKEFYHAEEFNLFFVGAGSTGGLTHLRKILGIYLPPVTEEHIQEDLSKELNPLIHFAQSIVRAPHEHTAERVAEAQKIIEKYGNEFNFKNLDKADWPVVFITSVEHHSVEVALRGDRVILVKVPLTPDHKFDLDAFQKLLNKPEFKNRKKIALMSAASNITGLKTPVVEVSKILKGADTEKVVAVKQVSESEISAVQNVEGIQLVLNAKTNSYEYVFSNRLSASDYQNLLLDERLRHRRELFVKLYRDVQAWAFFDAAAREPHEPFTEKEIEALDGFTVAAHKSEGGPGATGLLALKPQVYRADLKPTDGGAGGTVSFVSKKNHDFSGDVEERETAGTPPGLAIVRHALAIVQRMILGEKTTVGRERALGQKLFDFLRDDPNFNLIGSQNFADRVPIFSFDVTSGGHTELYF